jgi:hypothetical protein
MSDNDKRTDVNVSVAVIPWFTGWLFTIGYAKLHGLSILGAMFVWPAYLGSALSP